ncbi:MAG: hypothetical protein GDA48_10800 [Hormoscilla sp. GM102CHS1]|nr:hypothetical protein [Hormoscilla sp. GM102CHS1]MBO1348547.1 hypothetical protein [Hormoscilla sp. GUM202]
MTQLSSNPRARRGRIFPSRRLSPEEKARRQAEREESNQRCQVIFERVRPELIDEYYDWFIVIEPNSEEYFIEKDEMIAIEKACQKYPHAMCLMLRLNETGVCGRI